jgi:threonine/homoserine/homoserine lactone efflux protein
MSINLYVAFIITTVVLILVPGPNVALIVANSVARGTRYGLITVAGTSSAMVIQLTLTVLSMTTLMSVLATWFEWIRWLGVIYLVYLGIKCWVAPASDLSETKAQGGAAHRIYLRGLLVSLTNPKTLLFLGAFLPQFVNTESDPMGQLFLLAATFLVIAISLDGVWALLGGRVRAVLKLNGRHINRVSGGLLIGAGMGLALARKP